MKKIEMEGQEGDILIDVSEMENGLGAAGSNGKSGDGGKDRAANEQLPDQGGRDESVPNGPVTTGSATGDSEPGEAGDTVASKDIERDPIKILMERLDSARKDAEGYRERLLRVSADFENYRRRMAKEMEEARKYSIEAVLKDLLPVLDSFDRAMEHLSPDCVDNTSLNEGVRMVHRQFVDGLKKHGVESFSAKGQVFDPAVHEAISQVESSEVSPGRVIQEWQRGFKLHGRLIRPAMVVVAKAPEQAAPREERRSEAQKAASGDSEDRTSGEEDKDSGSPGDDPGCAVVEADASVDDQGIGPKEAEFAGLVVNQLGEAGPGVRVREVLAHFIGNKGDLEAGDVIISVNGAPTHGPASFVQLMRLGLGRDGAITLRFRKGGQPGLESEIVIGKQSANPAEAES